MKRYFLLGLIVIFYSCENNNSNDDCGDTTVESFSLEEVYGCVNTKYQLDINLVENFAIITNQSEFDQLISGSCNPSINFSIYDLVIGKKGLESGIASITYFLIQDCDDNYKLEVLMNTNETTEAPNITYHRLIPKLAQDQTIDVELILN